MKHTAKITLILIGMFFITQLIGILIAGIYSPEIIQVVNQTTGEIITLTQYNLPYGLEPPQEIQPQTSAISIIIALFIAVTLMLLLMKLKAEIFLRIWFLIVVILGIGLALNAFLIKIPNSALIALIIAIPLGLIKIFQRNIIVHNLTEMLIYPGIASVFIPILNIWSVVVLLIIISLYDMYAVWKAGFMQKMAKYQIEKLKIFSGFFIPYINKKDRLLLKNARQKTADKKTKNKGKKVKVNLAILGGGDVVFPILLAGVVLRTLGIFPAIIISIGATLSLAFLFYKSEKGKFYPAMPFISVGCLIALAVAYFI
ncbi:MAG: presenilin family intramembrane aspartyl protease [Candidatus Pacearchaeota archaeon]|nr:presenilin family intramembrane aspartyl protease [Candidatus Pacearchaeota archaeon]